MGIIVDPKSIVKECKIGNTTIKVADTAYKNRTPEEIQQTLKRIAEINLKILKSPNYKSI